MAIGYADVAPTLLASVVCGSVAFYSCADTVGDFCSNLGAPQLFPTQLAVHLFYVLLQFGSVHSRLVRGHLFACEQNEAKRYVQATGRDVTQRKDAKESFITILVGIYQFVSFLGVTICIIMYTYVYISILYIYIYGPLIKHGNGKSIVDR